MITELLPSRIVEDGIEYFIVLDETNNGLEVSYSSSDKSILICIVSDLIPTREDILILRNVFNTLDKTRAILIHQNYTCTVEQFLERVEEYESRYFRREQRLIT